MTEVLGLAMMTETPIVIADVMRGGPSTGLPTKTEQSDLNLAVYGGHGDSPRMVIAPSDVEDCFYTTVDAFTLAEKYQMPVILLSDYSLATRTQTIPRPDFNGVKAPQREVPTAEEIAAGYKRFKLTESGVSPMAVPGTPGGQFTATGLEHNETGAPHMTGAMHKTMTEKRYRKMAGAAAEPGYTRRFGSPQAKVGIVCWGTTTGPVREAVDRALAKGYPVAALQCRMVHPIPAEVRPFLESMDTVLVPELNWTGQFAQMLRGRFLKPVVQLNKIDGLPFTAEEIYTKIAELCDMPVGARSAS
jgi:2-oxoglutarate ferredoxin oxidoreductase subunit alpha